MENDKYKTIKEIEQWNTGVRRVTGRYMLRRLRAARATVLLGHSAALHSHAKPPPQFVGPGNAAHFLIRAAKPFNAA
jgi:hypothetical protein